ncbi:MAG: hypothetical protein ACPG3X_02665 [Opitutales bacterium]
MGRIILMLCLFVVAGPLDAQGRLNTAENTQFEVVGLDRRSVSYVDELSRHLVDVAARYLDQSGLLFPQRILVSLKPEAYVDFDGMYRIKWGEGGFVSLDLRWEDDLSLRTTCRALAEALMVRYAYFNYGEHGLGALPDWPAAAIGTKVYLSLRPAEALDLVRWFDLRALPSVDAVLQRKWTDSVFDANGYGFLLALERSGVTRLELRRLMLQSLAGVAISDSVGSLIQPEDPVSEPVDLAGWWRASVAQLMVPENDLMESMESSRFWISELSKLDGAGIEGLNLGNLWLRRQDPEVRSVIEARYEILRLRILRVNPAYFNAARALGRLFEACLNDDKKHQYMHRLVGFLSDFEDTRELEERVESLLSEAGLEG